MPVCSYLVTPSHGRCQEISSALSSLKGIDVFPAEDRELIVMVTDTEDQASEDRLQEELQQLDGIECMALSFGAEA